MLVRKRLIGAATLVLTLVCLPSGHGTGEERHVPDQPSGALLVEARCGFCHSAALLAVLAQRKLAEDGPEEVMTFLVGHHAPDAEARLAIFQFLSTALEAPN